MIITVSTAAELEYAFSTAQAGDQINLAPGDYDAVVLSNQSFEFEVIITSEDPENPAVFTDRLDIQNVDNLVLKNVDFTAETIAESARDERLYVASSSNITLSDITFTGSPPDETEGTAPDEAIDRLEAIAGYGYEVGLRVQEADGLIIENVEFSDLRTAISLGDVENAVLSDLYIHDVREGINLYDISDVTIQDSIFTEFTPWLSDNENASDDHPDMIQYWGANSDSGIRGLTIDNNLFYQPEGYDPTQSIFGHMDAATSGVFATDFTVTNNTIINSHLNALSLNDVTDAVIANNVLVPMLDQADDPSGLRTPSIVVEGSKNVDVYGNVMLPRDNGLIVQKTDAQMSSYNVNVYDNTSLSTDSSDPLFWRTLAEQLVSDAETAIANYDSDSTTLVDEMVALLSNDLLIIAGSDDTDNLRGKFTGNAIFGQDGDDVLSGASRGADDVFVGGEGADKFVLDMRTDQSQTTDIIIDLDFTEGDRLQVLAAEADTFFSQDGWDNNLQIMSNGATVFIDSTDDLEELAAADCATLTSTDDGLLMTFAASANRQFLFSTLDVNAAGVISQTTEVVPDVSIGTDGDETVSASKHDGGMAYGMGGDDVLRELSGEDWLWGNDGADKFVLDLRNALDASSDHLMDVDFDEGDKVKIVASDAGAFTVDETADTDRLYISSDGTQVQLDELDDLVTLVELGLATVSDADEGILVQFDYAVTRNFYFHSIEMYDLGL